MRARYSDRAIHELDHTVDWYESVQQGLGIKFLDAIESHVRNIEDNPKLYQRSHGSFRACPVRRFPYSLYYTLEISEVVIHAVFDNRQDPIKRP